MKPTIEHIEAVRPDSVIPAVVDNIPCYAFTLKNGDVQAWDVGNIGPSGKANQRAEISYAPAPGNLKVNSPYNVTEKTGLQTYDAKYRFKAGWPTTQRWAVLTQFHPQDDNPSGIHGFGGITVHGNEITMDIPDDPNGGYFYRSVIKTDVWYDFRLVVNWASNAAGYVKLIDRSTGKVLANYSGRTVAPGEFKYIKQGYYRDGGITAEGTVYETLLDITQGDASTTSPAPVPTPAPAPSPNTWSHGEEARALLIAQLPTLEAMVGVATKMRDDVKALLDKGQ